VRSKRLLILLCLTRSEATFPYEGLTIEKGKGKEKEKEKQIKSDDQ
jgi:hypothetical protein